jgi:uncharacterized protein (DUF433 family)
MGMQVDWSESPDVEVIEGKVSNKPAVKDRRIPADMLMVYYESLIRHGMKPEEAFADTDENYPGVGSERLKRLLEYAHSHQP